MKLEIKKIDKKIELDTKVEGCWSDCGTGKYVYSGYEEGCYNAGQGYCTKKEKKNAKTCWIW